MDLSPPPTPPTSLPSHASSEDSTAVYRHSSDDVSFVVRSYGKIIVIGDARLQFANGARVDVEVTRLGDRLLIVWDNDSCRVKDNEACTPELRRGIVAALRQLPVPPTPPPHR